MGVCTVPSCVGAVPTYQGKYRAILSDRSTEHAFNLVNGVHTMPPLGRNLYVYLFLGKSDSFGGPPFGVFSNSLASSNASGTLKNSCLFFHLIWLCAKSVDSAGGGGGSVILVTRYAVEASAMP